MVSQLSLDLPLNLPANAYEVGKRASGETHGVVLTKPHVVELILDLVGFTTEKDLAGMSLLEPSCGEGAFLLPAVGRLLEVAERNHVDLDSLGSSVMAFDIDPDHVKITRDRLCELLTEHDATKEQARRLAKTWVREDDFLLSKIAREFDFVVGNPPYIRIEQFSDQLFNEYRRRYRSLYDRADIYVAFIERGLSLLSKTGRLSFICADRWTLNKYGAPLRKIISEGYSLLTYIDLHQASPFDSEVIAYPSIFVMSRGKTSEVPLATLKTASPEECRKAATALKRKSPRSNDGVSVSVYPSWFSGEEPWVLSSPEHLSVLRDLESRFEPIEKHAKVGIGVATGNDKIYIVDSNADIESDRLVPLVFRDDITEGKIADAKRYVINTFDANGKIVDLRSYPRLARYLETHSEAVKKRHVAQAHPNSWFRTIDRVYPELVSRPKLLIPDIAGANEVAFDEGRFHPHHNLYFVTSEKWDLEVLGGLLSSRVALFFVWSYAVKMRGGYLRFQAQYLRRICLPSPKDIPSDVRNAIKSSFRGRDFPALDSLALQAFCIDAMPEFDFVDTRR